MFNCVCAKIADSVPTEVFYYVCVIFVVSDVVSVGVLSDGQ